MTYGDDAVKYDSIVIALLGEFCEISAGLYMGHYSVGVVSWRDDELLLEGRDPNKALVGYRLDSSQRQQIAWQRWQGFFT